MDTLKEYLEAHAPQTRDAINCVEEFADEISRMHGKCIDLGCGPGDVTRNVLIPKLPPDATVIGLDISESMLNFAKKEHSDEKRLSFLEFDLETDKVPTHLLSSFQNAVSFYCLHWCKNMGKVLENIHKLLRPNGKALVLFLAHNTGFDSYQTISKYPEYQPYMKDVFKYVSYFQNCENPRASFKKMLEEAGFKVLHCSLREKTYIYKNRQTLQKHIVAVNPFMSRMPEDVAKQFKDDLTDEIISRKFSFLNTDDEPNSEYRILDRYYCLVAYFEKVHD